MNNYMEPIISLKNITQSYGPIKVLHSVDLEVPKGAFFVIVGPSGCGKSTLMKILTGIEKPVSGSVNTPNEMSMVFQNGSLLPWRTVYDNIALALETSSLSDLERDRAIKDSIIMMGLEAFTTSYPKDLSGGQRQRVGIARALVSNPKVLLLDEPFSALDAETTENLHAELLKLWKDKGLTIVMISHALDEAIELADAIYVMQSGKFIDTEVVSLPRPRSLHTPEFGALHDKLRKLLQKEQRA